MWTSGRTERISSKSQRTQWRYRDSCDTDFVAHNSRKHTNDDSVEWGGWIGEEGVEYVWQKLQWVTSSQIDILLYISHFIKRQQLYLSRERGGGWSWRGSLVVRDLLPHSPRKTHSWHLSNMSTMLVCCCRHQYVFHRSRMMVGGGSWLACSRVEALVCKCCCITGTTSHMPCLSHIGVTHLKHSAPLSNRTHNNSALFTWSLEFDRLVSNKTKRTTALHCPARINQRVSICWLIGQLYQYFVSSKKKILLRKILSVIDQMLVYILVFH